MKKPVQFIVYLGIVSLFADMTYEGARGIIGPYLSFLGANGAAVGLIIGIGELIAYTLRGISGVLVDRTRLYWLFTFIGYIINLFAVPLLALANRWEMAAVLIILERFGKAIRVPSRDAMLSYATKHTGRGWGFGLHEAMDQIGAVLGPLFIAIALFYHESYQWGFAFLVIPAVLALVSLVIARISFPTPQNMEVEMHSLAKKGLSKPFWIYVAAVGFVAMGFANFALISYHFQKTDAILPQMIAFLYAIANGVAGVSSLFMGRLFDRKGIPILAGATLLSSFFAPLVFWGGSAMIILGIVLWGIGVGSQESILRAAVAHYTPPHKRGSAYGILNLVFGAGWGIGSLVIGTLYDVSIGSVVLFSVLAQWISIPLFFFAKMRRKNS